MSFITFRPVERQPATGETNGQTKCPPQRQEMKEAEKRGSGPLPLPNHTPSYCKLGTESLTHGHLGDISNSMTAVCNHLSTLGVNMLWFECSSSFPKHKLKPGCLAVALGSWVCLNRQLSLLRPKPFLSEFLACPGWPSYSGSR